ncbi:MAG TPA: GNAT family N-acetyltransferase [Desulfitobacteriaceae bacterium]|nr:GNAT family N-acetyltransferase [Desulfitobacteriaceae bacterium]
MGKPGICLEDLYITPGMRGKGFGKIRLSFLAKLALARKWARLEWSCLDWNEPSLELSKGLGAVSLEDWTMYRLSGKTLEDLAGSY